MPRHGGLLVVYFGAEAWQVEVGAAGAAQLLQLFSLVDILKMNSIRRLKPINGVASIEFPAFLAELVFALKKSLRDVREILSV